MSEQSSYCTFRVGAMRLGVEVHRVQEVIRAQVMTRIPGANEVVRGLMNLRGQIVTALDLQRRLEIDRDEEGEGDPLMNVVVRTADGPVSLLVHEIGDVVVVDGADFEAPPETLADVHRDLISGAYKLDCGLLLVLDTEAVLRIAA
jgi:purine-binding chemotaxis protein CheW